MQTIIVIFTERKLSLNEMAPYKRYKLLCNYNTVSLNEIVEDPRYTGKMMVVGFTCDTDRVQQGITLKDIYITKVNGQVINQSTGLVNGSLTGSDFDIDRQRTDNMKEKRNIKVTLEQAIEWYNSDNEALKKLATTVFTEEEIILNKDYIFSKVKDLTATLIPSVDDKKFTTLADLAVIAKYFNGNWEKNTYNTGYFLGSFNAGCGPVVDVCSGIGIYKHDTLKYAGIVYFKNQEDAIKAIKILGDKVRNLF